MKLETSAGRREGGKPVYRRDKTQGRSTARWVIYGLYNKKNFLLFLGVTDNLSNSIERHKLSKEFEYVSILRLFGDATEARDFAKQASNHIKPIYNLPVEAIDLRETTVEERKEFDSYGQTVSKWPKRPRSNKSTSS